MAETAATQPPGSVEQRAEELVERVISDGLRWLRRVSGRAREEIEDIMAEARQLHRGPADEGSN